MESKAEQTINKEKFVKIPDEDKIFNKHAIMLPDGRIFEVGIHPVIFGYRVIGCFKNSQSFELNWCCGDNKIVIYATQKIIMNLLEQGTPWNEIPFSSDIKPWPKDKDFIDRVAKLVKNPILHDIVAVMESTKPDL